MKRLLLLFAVLMSMPFYGISQSVSDINRPTIGGLDEVAPFSEGMAAVRKGEQWGFIDKEGHLVIDFRSDLVWNRQASNAQGVAGIRYPEFKGGMSIISKRTEEDIPLYGFINTKGETVIEPEFVNVSPFEAGHAVGIYANKTHRGKNEFQLDIYDYGFTEVLLNKEGEMIWPVQQRQGIIMSKRRFKLPELRTRLLSEDLLTVKDNNNKWKIVKMTPGGE
ncbi:WG repeat-containing protein [Pricia sp. S334]|uniref:WG repeat-containing protein n=1 Tax=Pricia mediterranea TaxID=3076079 RepID=A0ABU3L9R8_9FLAO|nr:WG repeat-containing protein [Pricia sp. S334]MDT7830041.1 WG repeat-containing protein [Pricia sp. S334]